MRSYVLVSVLLFFFSAVSGVVAAERTARAPSWWSAAESMAWAAMAVWGLTVLVK